MSCLHNTASQEVWDGYYLCSSPQHFYFCRICGLVDQILVMGSHLWKGGLFSQMLGTSQNGFMAPSYFVGSWLLSFELSLGLCSFIGLVEVWLHIYHQLTCGRLLQSMNPPKCAYHDMLMGEQMCLPGFGCFSARSQRTVLPHSRAMS